MNEDTFNMEVRKFLKQLGVTSQRAMEAAVRAAVASGRLKGDEVLKARAVVTLDGLELRHEVTADIPLE
ncbi:MAG TPA: DUF6494 family protein [Azospirillaceae bacterium]|nr:DUF6494 family protein [Azospirillaceae bacterium]